MKKAFSVGLPVLLLFTACAKKNVPEAVNLISLPTITATVSTLAGSGSPGLANGFGNAASFNLPLAVASDAAGNLYVADLGNNLIRKINVNSIVTTLAGSAGSGSVNGPGTVASFSQPSGIAVDAAGNVYVADSGNNLVRKINPDGIVTTLAGSGVPGSANGAGTAASFFIPTGVAADAGGNVYVADYGNNLVRKINPNGIVTTLAGANPADGSLNGPTGVAVDAAGNLYIADYENNRIAQGNKSGQIITLAFLYHPSGLTISASGNIYAVLPLDNQVWQVNSDRTSIPFAGSGNQGSNNGTATAASFYSPSGIASDAAGNIYVADSGNNLIREIAVTEYK